MLIAVDSSDGSEGNKSTLHSPSNRTKKGKRELMSMADDCFIAKRWRSDVLSVLVSDRLGEFPDETFIEEGGKLYCQGCRKHLALKKSTVKSHIAGIAHISNVAKIFAAEC